MNAKRLYIKPTFHVVILRQQTRLLVGSKYPEDWNGPVGYSPDIPYSDAEEKSKA